MIRLLRIVPATLAFALLAAHFLRGGLWALVGLSLASPALLFVRGRTALRLVRALLLAGCALWVLTAWRIARSRIAAGEPFVRMAAILGAVAAFTAAAAFLIPGRSPRAGDRV